MDHLKRAHPESLKAQKTVIPTCMEKFLERENSYDNSSARKIKIDNAIMRMITLDVQPFSIVKDEGFRDLIHILDPRYKLPSNSYLRNVVLKNEYEVLKGKLKSVLGCVEYVAITTDYWTSKANEGCLTVTCHFVDYNFELKSVVLSTTKLVNPTNHTAINIADSLRVVLSEWDVINKVVSVVTDNDATMKKACELLGMKNLPCFSHTINLLVQDVLELPTLLPILTKCKRIVTFFKSSRIAYEKFKKSQGVEKPFSLVQEVPTRWNSAFQMMKRILLTNEFISAVLLNTTKAPQPFSAEEIDILKELTNILSPFQDATLSISASKKVTISLIIPLICELHKKMNDMKNKLKSAEAISAFTLLNTRLAERFFPYETRTVPRISTLLDPRFRKDGFMSSSNADQAAKALEQEAYTFLSKSPREQPTPPQQQNQPRVFSFLQQKAASRVKSHRVDAILVLRQHLEKVNEPEECDPLKYWKMSPEDMLALKTTSKQFFCVPASSCESERMFSKAGQIISERRCCLKPNIVDQLLFLNKNQDVIT